MSTRAELISPPGTLAALWWGWIGAPTWWLIQFQCRYALIPWACSHASPLIIPEFGIAALVGSLALVVWAWRANRKSNGDQPYTFLITGGFWNAVLFALLVFAQVLPDFFFDPCLR